jgi:hypothetical protein
MESIYPKKVMLISTKKNDKNYKIVIAKKEEDISKLINQKFNNITKHEIKPNVGLYLYTTNVQHCKNKFFNLSASLLSGTILYGKVVLIDISKDLCENDIITIFGSKFENHPLVF